MGQPIKPLKLHSEVQGNLVLVILGNKYTLI